MVIHYPSGRLRRDGDRPTAVIGMLVAASASSYRTGDIPLGTPTCSARSRHGLWALYPNGDGVIVVWPGGANQASGRDLPSTWPGAPARTTPTNHAARPPPQARTSASRLIATQPDPRPATIGQRPG